MNSKEITATGQPQDSHKTDSKKPQQIKKPHQALGGEVEGLFRGQRQQVKQLAGEAVEGIGGEVVSRGYNDIEISENEFRISFGRQGERKKVSKRKRQQDEQLWIKRAKADLCRWRVAE